MVLLISSGIFVSGGDISANQGAVCMASLSMNFKDMGIPIKIPRLYSHVHGAFSYRLWHISL